MGDLPESFATASFAAIIAALGYLAKLAIEAWTAHRQTRRERFARLVQLESLLRAAKVGFLVQAEHRDRLFTTLRHTHPGVVANTQTFDDAFSKAFPSLSEEQKILHSIIRGITINSMQATNEALSAWLKDDTYFKSRRRSGRRTVLAKMLADLEAHLLLWHSKYNVWIPEHPEHALVYTSDEERHGVRFPQGIDERVTEALDAFL